MQHSSSTETLLLLLLLLQFAVCAAGEECRLLAFSIVFFLQHSRSTVTMLLLLLLLLLLLTVCAAGEECRLPDFPCTMFTCNPAAALNGPLLTVEAITAAAHGAAAAAAAADSRQTRRRAGTTAAAAAGVPQGPLQLVACPRMCLQRRPLMVSANFSNDGTSIQVKPWQSFCRYLSNVDMVL
jgi:hypothetical protein